LHGPITTNAQAAGDLRSAHCGEGCLRSEMLVLEEEQGPPTLGAIERTVLDHA
jgi:hypothetical protein